MKKITMLFSLIVMLTGCTTGLKEQLAQNAQTIQSLNDQVVDLRAENQGLQQQLAEAKQGRIPSGVIAVDAGSSRGMAYGEYQNVSAGTVVSNSDSGYDNALQLYRAGDINGAIDGFQQYLNSGAVGEQAVLAQYWIGDGYYTQRNYEQASRYLGTFLKNSPQNNKAQPALTKLITALRALGREEDANILQNIGISAIQ